MDIAILEGFDLNYGNNLRNVNYCLLLASGFLFCKIVFKNKDIKVVWIWACHIFGR